MAAIKPTVVLFCLAVALSLSCCAAAGDAAVPKGVQLSHPIGSGLNSPVKLNLTPKRGRRFINIMKQFVDAARLGDLTLVQKLQQQLFALTKPKHHRRRSLLQTGPARDACPALPGTLQDNNNPPLAGPAASGNANTITPPATPATGPLPTIRFATLEPCAEWGCRNRFSLVRQSDGTVRCQARAATNTVPVLPFAYFQVYDYDLFWNTDSDNVVAGAYVGSTLTNKNALTSKRGTAGAASSLNSETLFRFVPDPFLGVRADTTAGAGVDTGVEVSKAVGDNAVLKFKTTLPKVSVGGSYGVVLPGTKVTEREGEASDSNVVFPANAPALYAFGKRKH